MLVAVCEEIGDREGQVRGYFRAWRKQIGEDGVIVMGHPHCSWLGSQISPSAIFYQWNDFPDVYIRSMDAVFAASLFIMSIAMEEGIDFMSDSSYGLDMTSPELFQTMDLPYIQRFSAWTHERGGLFWYHNCGFTRRLIMDGAFNAMGADVIETIAPPPEGDNSLGESRKFVDPGISTKGNFSLGLLRDGTPADIGREATVMVEAVRGFPHIFSTADAVLPGTPGANFVALVTSLHDALGG
jgi:uroporphyrinogen-III decarboxylase